MAQATPPSLKGINIFLKTATEIESRDPIVAYYCRLHALEKGMSIDKRSPDARQFLTSLMGQLESSKTELSRTNPEVFTPDSVVGQAAVENKALQLFAFADNRDRSGDFGPTTVKSFYTAGVLLDVLQSFGTVGEELEKCRKYAKWKALYITQCRKNGETPHAGPLGGEEGGEEAPDMSQLGGGASAAAAAPAAGFNLPPSQQPPPQQPSQPPPPQRPATPPQQQAAAPAAAASGTSSMPAPGSRIQAGAPHSNLSMDQYTKAGKLCKFAGSALQYQDAKTAIDYLVQALNLLQTGSE
ncbi:hypothetical protein BOX15_Mlig017931g1 [Macrostomum lignano]|uniref:Vta1/callose synthase N-terminal domain-containing protein n=1 Tax=Macrostomum lignano TaxID=282301 RepID=A0A267H518_9PLAT|nr:hypothetical protein BOX15_Mlig017931g1 [Macrostomum lignano]